jgi:tetratricopeptide (TPR) repeat protein
VKTRQVTAAIAALLLTTLVFGLRPVCAHVEGHMPDSVAEMEYRILLEFKPDEYDIRVKLATALMNQNKLAEAEQEFNRVLAAVPRHVQAQLGLSRLGLKQNKTAEALRIIKKVVEIAPDKPEVYLCYGAILAAANRFPEARAMYEKGLAKLAADSDDHENRAKRELLEKALRELADKPIT